MLKASIAAIYNKFYLLRTNVWYVVILQFAHLEVFAALLVYTKLYTRRGNAIAYNLKCVQVGDWRVK